jgi:hypothetical protein
MLCLVAAGFALTIARGARAGRPTPAAIAPAS